MTANALTTAPRRIIDPAKLGMWFFLATIAMLFAAFASAYLIRMASGDWKPIALPPVLWLNTATLIAASVALEVARHRTGTSRKGLVGLALALGLLFAAGQIAAWLQLIDAGILVPTSPHASFLYILTGLHGLHVLGGAIFLTTVWATLLFSGDVRPAERRIGLCAHYWHFMGGLWVFLFAVLHLG